MKSHFEIERLVVAFSISVIAGIAFLGILVGLSVPILFSAFISLVLLIVLTILLKPKIPQTLNGIIGKRPWLAAAWLILSLIAIVQVARLSVFMIDNTKSDYSVFPNDKWMIEHCCLTAYNESAALLSSGEKNIYNPKLYYNRKSEGFNVDLYHYPPTFLLLPITLRDISGGNFLSLRTLWFGISLFFFLLAMVLVIYKLESKAQLRAIGMAPLILFSMPVLSGLQMSNVQIIVVSISVISLVLFSKQKAAGGMLLAMSSVAKIFPGILFLFLLIQRKWRSAAWTAGFAILLSLITFIVLGPNVFNSFFSYELPRLSSGEAFERPFSRLFAVSRNMSPFGIPLKLEQLGIHGMSIELGRIISNIYLVIVIGLAIWAARKKDHSFSETVSIWLSLLSLGTLVSPFAPANYVLITLVWLVCINRNLFKIRYAVIIWLLISLPFFLEREGSFLLQVLGYLPAQVLALAVPAFVLYRAGLKKAADKTNENIITKIPVPDSTSIVMNNKGI